MGFENEIRQRLELLEGKVESLVRMVKKFQEYFAASDEQAEGERKAVLEKEVQYQQNCRLLNKVIEKTEDKLKRFELEMLGLQERVEKTSSRTLDLDQFEATLKGSRQFCLQVVAQARLQVLTQVEQSLARQVGSQTGKAESKLSEVKESVHQLEEQLQEVKELVMQFAERTEKKLQNNMQRLQARLGGNYRP